MSLANSKVREIESLEPKLNDKMQFTERSPSPAVSATEGA
jgi:hypothetical protein